MSYTLPPTKRVAGNTGHVGDHDNIANVLAGIPPVVYNVLNSAYGGGADPTGTDDSTDALQAVLNAVKSAGGGCLYVPSGKYLVGGELSYESNSPIRICGDGPQASNFILNSKSSSSSYLNITQTGTLLTGLGNDGTVLIENLSFYNNANSPSFTDVNNAIALTGVNYGQISNVGIYRNSAAQRLNQGMVFNECNLIDVNNCSIYAVANGVVCTGYCQSINLRNCNLHCLGNVAIESTGACIYVSGRTLTLHISQTVVGDGERGLLWTRDAHGNIPHILVAMDFEVNNHSIAGMELAYGSQVWLSQCVFSGGVGTGTPGLLVDKDFQGSLYCVQGQFCDIPGHGVQILGGPDNNFVNCYFGGATGTSYKSAAGTYDEVNIGSGVGDTTIDACHFDVAFGGQGTPAPRSAVYVASGAGNVTVSNSKGKGTSYYGASALVDNAGTLMRNGNIGLGLADTTTAGGETVTGTTMASLSKEIPVPANDMTAGTVYKVTAAGRGTQASGTAVTLTGSFNIDGSGLGTWSPAANIPAGDTFYWTYECSIHVLAAGSSGTVSSNEKFTWGVAGGAGNVIQNGHPSFTVNTTQSNQFGLTAEWSSAAGSPTIVCDTTVLERINSYPAS
jgi:hypothetical protein